MHKPSIPTPHIKLNKKVGVLLGTVLVLVIILAGLAATEAHNKAENHRQAVATAQARQAEANRTAHEQAVEAQLVRVTSQRDQACSYLTTLASQKTTRSLVTVPVVACQK